MGYMMRFLGVLFSVLLFPTLSFGSTWGVYLGGETQVNGNGEAVVTPKAFIPIDISQNSLVFIDLRTVVNTADLNNTNLAFGYRNNFERDMAFGVNGAVDITKSEKGNILAQAGLGVEFLSRYVDVAANFYAPLNTADVAGTGIEPYAKIVDNKFQLVYQDPDRERSRFGSDLYVRARLPITKGLMVELTGGVFYYFATDYAEAIYGAHAQAELTYAFEFFGLDSSIGLAGGIKTQNTFEKPQWYVGVEFSIGLGPSAERRAGNSRYGYRRSPMRDGTPRIALKPGHSEVQYAGAKTLINGQYYEDIFTLTANDDIVDGVNNAGEDSIVVLKGDEGTFEITTGVVVQEGQVIIGDGTALVIRGPEGRTAVLLVGGDRAVVNNNGTDNTFTLSADSLLQGVDINGGNDGVYFYQADGASMVNVNISNAAGNGVTVSDSYDVTISDASIVNSAYSGVQIDNSDEVIIVDSFIDQSGVDGVNSFDNGDVTIKNTTISDSTFDGVDSNNDLSVTIEDSLIVDSGDNGVEAEDTQELNIDNTDIIDSGDDGVNAIDVNEVNITDSEIDGAADDGVDVSTVSSGTLNISNTTVRNVSDDAVYVYASVRFDTVIDSLTVQNSGTAIYYDGAGDLTITNSNFNSSTGVVATIFTEDAVIDNVDINATFDGISVSGDTITINNSIIESSLSTAIVLTNFDSATISDVTAEGYDGIKLINGQNAVVANAYVLAVDEGILVDQTSSANLTNNIIDQRNIIGVLTAGIVINDSDAVDVSDNQISRASEGVTVIDSNDVTGDNNTTISTSFPCFIDIQSFNIGFYVNGSLCEDI
jgi:hypothetical protein